MTIDTNDLLPLTTFLALLPGVKPRRARQLLVEEMGEAVYEERDHFFLQERRVTLDESNEFFVSNDNGTDCVTPRAAHLLIELYRLGALPRSNKAPAEPSAEALAYADSQPALEHRAAAAAAARDAYKRKVSDPGSIREEEFSYRLLDDVFWAHKGPGGGDLVIGGVAVQKDVSSFFSNSGSSRDSRVVFRWLASDGEAQELVKPSGYESNRRNDKDRDWGLPD